MMDNLVLTPGISSYIPKTKTKEDEKKPIVDVKMYSVL
jgi:hypothetical protein